jgi:hypothetical protein
MDPCFLLLKLLALLEVPEGLELTHNPLEDDDDDEDSTAPFSELSLLI